jgi:hypothetical protein
MGPACPSASAEKKKAADVQAGAALACAMPVYELPYPRYLIDISAS